MKLTQKEKIKICAKRKNLSMTAIYTMLELSKQSGHYKLLSGTFTESELAKIADILEIKIEEIRRDY